MPSRSGSGAATGGGPRKQSPAGRRDDKRPSRVLREADGDGDGGHCRAPRRKWHGKAKAAAGGLHLGGGWWVGAYMAEVLV